MNKGYVIMAQNSSTVNYIECAEKLANSIKRVMPDANVTIITSDMLPYGDKGGFYNDWQVYEASPYEYTIKLEADMYIPTNIDYWWDVLKDRDLFVCSTIRNFKGEVSDVKAYRKFITDNKLPDVYNAITYFKKSADAEYFFKLVRNIFENWDEYKSELKCDPREPASTDWVYAIACHIMGAEKATVPGLTQISMTHMKQFINNTFIEDWTKELLVEYHNGNLKINTYPQQYPFHYHIKEFSKTL